jgi:hypothetical protein
MNRCRVEVSRILELRFQSAAKLPPLAELSLSQKMRYELTRKSWQEKEVPKSDPFFLPPFSCQLPRSSQNERFVKPQHLQWIHHHHAEEASRSGRQARDDLGVLWPCGGLEGA